MLLFLLAAAQQMTPLPVRAEPYQPATATLVVEPVAMMLAACDADDDVRVTRAEATACVARSFGTPAGGGIGYIAFADWAERWLGDRNAVPSPFEIDRDGDNRITLAELQDRMAAIFARFDADRDGVLVRKELLTIRTPPPRLDRRGRNRGPAEDVMR